jgi:hypothetical protein
MRLEATPAFNPSFNRFSQLVSTLLHLASPYLYTEINRTGIFLILCARVRKDMDMSERKFLSEGWQFVTLYPFCLVINCATVWPLVLATQNHFGMNQQKL